MMISSNGGAMPDPVYASPHNVRNRKPSGHEEFLADLRSDTRFTRNIKKLISGRSALELPASTISQTEQSRIIRSCMRSVYGGDALEAAALVIANLIEDMADEECSPALIDHRSPTLLSWTKGMDCILGVAPSYATYYFYDVQMHSGSNGLAMTHSSMSAWLTREGCAWFIDQKGFPRIAGQDQALMYLISGNSCHNRIGESWFAKNPNRARPRSWWFNRHPHLAFFYGAQVSSSCKELLAPAFAD